MPSNYTNYLGKIRKFLELWIYEQYSSLRGSQNKHTTTNLASSFPELVLLGIEPGTSSLRTCPQLPTNR